MSAIAQVLHEQGAAVKGSNNTENEVVRRLRAEGIEVTVGHDAANVDGADIVVYSAAIPDDNPEMVEALGHNVRNVFMMVFGGGSALAGLAGVIGGVVFVTEPSMAAVAGAIIFVVIVVGGMGSLAGAFLASLLIGLIQTFALASDYPLGGLLGLFGVTVTPDTFGYAVWKLTIAQIGPVLPFLLLVLILIVRPRGLMGTRES